MYGKSLITHYRSLQISVNLVNISCKSDRLTTPNTMLLKCSKRTKDKFNDVCAFKGNKERLSCEISKLAKSDVDCRKQIIIYSTRDRISDILKFLSKSKSAMKDLPNKLKFIFELWLFSYAFSGLRSTVGHNLIKVDTKNKIKEFQKCPISSKSNLSVIREEE